MFLIFLFKYKKTVYKQTIYIGVITACLQSSSTTHRVLMKLVCTNYLNPLNYSQVDFNLFNLYLNQYQTKLFLTQLVLTWIIFNLNLFKLNLI